MVIALQSKEMSALSQGLCWEGTGTPVEAGQGWNSGAHDVSWHSVSFSCLFSFVSFTYLSARSDFPCDFYSWVVCDNFPFYQRTWLFGPYISVQLIFIMQKCIEDAVPSLVERLHESQSWSQAAEDLCSLHVGTFTSVLTCTCLCVDSLFLYLDQLYYSQDLI